MVSKTPKSFTYTGQDRHGRLVTRRLSGANLAAAVEAAVLGPARECEAFFESPAFETLMGQFRSATRRGVVEQEAVVYAHRSFPFTADDFRRAFESVMAHAPGAPRQETTPSDFTRLTKTYRGLDFSVLIGQGSTYSIARSSHSEVKPA